MEEITFELSTHTDAIKSLQAESEKYNSKVTALEAQLQKDNLRFHGIKMHVVDSIKTFLIASLNIPVANMEILCCFRIGKPDPNKTDDTRKMLAKFLRSNDVSLIMTATRKKPKGSPGCVQEDLPLLWAKTQQELHKLLRNVLFQQEPNWDPRTLKSIGLRTYSLLTRLKWTHQLHEQISRPNCSKVNKLTQK